LITSLPVMGINTPSAFWGITVRTVDGSSESAFVQPNNRTLFQLETVSESDKAFSELNICFGVFIGLFFG
ncbi:hypothetical protein, partial [Neisseria yangbaofengii]|uniref:hypothetical protein n=1 Tax=Neisseria yangbaofengii TaxID=2709396 RepID=UPI00197DB5C2